MTQIGKSTDMCRIFEGIAGKTEKGERKKEKQKNASKKREIKKQRTKD
jgi:hypothetical protein